MQRCLILCFGLLSLVSGCASKQEVIKLDPFFFVPPKVDVNGQAIPNTGVLCTPVVIHDNNSNGQDTSSHSIMLQNLETRKSLWVVIATGSGEGFNKVAIRGAVAAALNSAGYAFLGISFPENKADNIRLSSQSGSKANADSESNNDINVKPVQIQKNDPKIDIRNTGKGRDGWDKDR